MLAVERIQFIKRRLKENKVVSVSELSKEMQVTEETIRKDLEKLEQSSLLCRVHGGAYLKEGYSREVSAQVRSRIYQEEKESLAELSMKYIKEGSSLILDCSTTAVCIAKVLARENKKVTVVTNSLLTAWELEKGEQIRLIMLGGTLDRNTDSFYGNSTIDELKEYYVDQAFISSAGISTEAGITDYSLQEADIRRLMIRQAGRCVYVADSTKLGHSSLYVAGELSEIGLLLTDKPVRGVDESLYGKLAGQGVLMDSVSESGGRKTGSHLGGRPMKKEERVI